MRETRSAFGEPFGRSSCAELASTRFLLGPVSVPRKKNRMNIYSGSPRGVECFAFANWVSFPSCGTQIVNITVTPTVASCAKGWVGVSFGWLWETNFSTVTECVCVCELKVSEAMWDGVLCLFKLIINSEVRNRWFR